MPFKKRSGFALARTVEKTMMELLYISERARTAPLISPTASSIAAIIPLSDRGIDAHSLTQRDTRAQKLGEGTVV